MNLKRTIIGGLFLLTSTNVLAWGNWVDEPYDKVLHVTFSTGVVVGGYGILHHRYGWSKKNARLATVATAAGLGLLKEISDQNFDTKDLAASIGGAVLGLGITFTF